MKHAKILIADDERNIRLMLRTTLEPEGYVIEEAADGRAALDAIEKSAPDLVVLDLNMPVMDGMSVLERLDAGQGFRPKVIVLTAYGSIPAAVRATRLGARDFIEKPATPDEVRETVRAVLDERDAADEGTPHPPVTDEQLAGGYAAVLDRVRKALRSEDAAGAEALLMRVADLSAGRDAPYFNLLGVLYETQGRWRLAKKFYGKAIRADAKYEPSQQNMARIYELETFGRTQRVVALGDEGEESALTRLLRERAALSRRP
jgi:DNA-binding response OmpR family regulator